MILDFEHMEKKSLTDFKGGQGKLTMGGFSDEHVRVMELTLEPGASIGLHTHQGNSEIIYILSGTGKVLYDGAYETLVPGACHYCPEGHEHSLINDGEDELRVFAVVPECGK